MGAAQQLRLGQVRVPSDCVGPVAAHLCYCCWLAVAPLVMVIVMLGADPSSCIRCQVLVVLRAQSAQCALRCAAQAHRSWLWLWAAGSRWAARQHDVAAAAVEQPVV